ncbi:MAG: hypothetical protein LC808_03515 [Actinobacteria bacterium]|nr:hypothetical protein [Actinomycetota bacterium]
MESNDLRERLHQHVRQTAMQDGIPPRDLQAIHSRGRKRIVLRRAVAASLCVVVASGAVALGRAIDLNPRDKEILPTTAIPHASAAERAGVFAIRAIAHAGLADQEVPGRYADYEGVEQVGTGWETTFTLIRCKQDVEYVGCSPDDTIRLLVARSADDFHVAEAIGPLGDEERARLLEYTEDASAETPALADLSLSFIKDGDGQYMRGRTLWTGPIPFDGFVRCRSQVIDASGDVVEERAEREFAPAFGPEEGDDGTTEAERDDALIWPPIRVPPGTDDPRGRYLCTALAFSPKQALDTARFEFPSAYVFDDFSLQYLYFVEDPQNVDRARIHYRGDWQGSEYPGVRRCTFTAYGSDGQELGETESLIEVLDPWERSAGIEEIDVAEIPQSVDVECQPDRVDDIRGRFSFSEIQIASDSNGTIEVRAELTWDGSEVPAEQDCVVRLYDASDKPLGEEDFLMSVRDPAQSRTFRHSIHLDDSVNEAPERAEIECLPYAPTTEGHGD